MSVINASRGRGILAISKFIPLRRPGQSSGRAEQSSRQGQAPKSTSRNGPTVTRSVEGFAKYNYKANPNSPLGSPELSLKQMEKLLVHDPHPVQGEHWVLVSTEDGSKGYVPLSYVYFQDNGLPWLANQRLEEEKEEPEKKSELVKPVGKPYRSAYAREQAEKQYRCEMCAKSFNGPTPYHLHLNSRNHKEEEEYRKQQGYYD